MKTRIKELEAKETPTKKELKEIRDYWEIEWSNSEKAKKGFETYQERCKYEKRMRGY